MLSGGSCQGQLTGSIGHGRSAVEMLGAGRVALVDDRMVLSQSPKSMWSRACVEAEIQTDADSNYSSLDAA